MTDNLSKHDVLRDNLLHAYGRKTTIEALQDEIAKQAASIELEIEMIKDQMKEEERLNDRI